MVSTLNSKFRQFLDEMREMFASVLHSLRREEDDEIPQFTRLEQDPPARIACRRKVISAANTRLEPLEADIGPVLEKPPQKLRCYGDTYIYYEPPECGPSIRRGEKSAERFHINAGFHSVKETTPCPRGLSREERTSFKDRLSRNGSRDRMCIIANDHVDRNLTDPLQISLADGNFSAEFSLANLPYGDITISMQGHRLQIMVEEESHQSSRKAAKCLSHCGYIAIPMYIDPDTISTRLNEEKNSLEMRGNVKGYTPNIR